MTREDELLEPSHKSPVAKRCSDQHGNDDSESSSHTKNIHSETFVVDGLKTNVVDVAAPSAAEAHKLSSETKLQVQKEFLLDSQKFSTEITGNRGSSNENCQESGVGQTIMTVVSKQTSNDSIREIQTTLQVTKDHVEESETHKTDNENTEKKENFNEPEEIGKVEEILQEISTIKENCVQLSSSDEKDEIADSNKINGINVEKNIELKSETAEIVDNEKKNTESLRGPKGDSGSPRSRPSRRSQDVEDPIARLNALRANIANALKEVKSVLDKHGDQSSQDQQTNTLDGEPPIDDTVIRFRFVRKIRRQSKFDEDGLPIKITTPIHESLSDKSENQPSVPTEAERLQRKRPMSQISSSDENNNEIVASMQHNLAVTQKPQSNSQQTNVNEELPNKSKSVQSEIAQGSSVVKSVPESIVVAAAAKPEPAITEVPKSDDKIRSEANSFVLETDLKNSNNVSGRDNKLTVDNKIEKISEILFQSENSANDLEQSRIASNTKNIKKIANEESDKLETNLKDEISETKNNTQDLKKENESEESTKDDKATKPKLKKGTSLDKTKVKSDGDSTKLKIKKIKDDPKKDDISTAKLNGAKRSSVKTKPKLKSSTSLDIPSEDQVKPTASPPRRKSIATKVVQDVNKKLTPSKVEEINTISTVQSETDQEKATLKLKNQTKNKVKREIKKGEQDEIKDTTEVIYPTTEDKLKRTEIIQPVQQNCLKTVPTQNSGTISEIEQIEIKSVSEAAAITVVPDQQAKTGAPNFRSEKIQSVAAILHSVPTSIEDKLSESSNDLAEKKLEGKEVEEKPKVVEISKPVSVPESSKSATMTVLTGAKTDIKTDTITQQETKEIKPKAVRRDSLVLSSQKILLKSLSKSDTIEENLKNEKVTYSPVNTIENESPTTVTKILTIEETASENCTEFLQPEKNDTPVSMAAEPKTANQKSEIPDPPTEKAPSPPDLTDDTESEMTAESSGNATAMTKKRRMKKKVVIKRVARKLSKDFSVDEKIEQEICEKEILKDDLEAEELLEKPEPVKKKSCIKIREYGLGDVVMYADQVRKQVKWKRAVVLEKITSISYKLSVDGVPKPAHVSYIKKFTDKKVQFGGKEYLEIDYAQEDSDEDERPYNIWARV